MGNDSGKNKNCAETEVAHNRAQFLAVSKGKKIITRDDLEVSGIIKEPYREYCLP